jgi:hypothetical protein
MAAIGFPLGSAFRPVGLAFIVCGVAILTFNFAFFLMLGSSRPRREAWAERQAGEK